MKNIPNNEEHNFCIQYTKKLNAIITSKSSHVEKEYSAIYRHKFHAAKWNWKNNTCCLYIGCDHAYKNLHEVIEEIKKNWDFLQDKKIKVSLNFYYNDMKSNSRVTFFTDSFSIE